MMDIMGEKKKEYTESEGSKEGKDQFQAWLKGREWEQVNMKNVGDDKKNWKNTQRRLETHKVWVNTK